MTKYRWIAARKAEGFPVRLCCRVVEIASSSYYDWWHVHGAGARSRELDGWDITKLHCAVITLSRVV